MNDLLQLKGVPGESRRAAMARILRVWSLIFGLAEIMLLAAFDQNIFGYGAIAFFAVYVAATQWAMRIEDDGPDPVLW